MEQKIRVGIVSYLNTRPLIYGLQRLPIKDKIELIEAYPASLADLLKSGAIDLGLVPVAIIPELLTYEINGNYCIGAIGDVASVALFSERHVTEIKKIYLDYQSRSSVQLLKWLVQHHWKIAPEFIEAKDESYIHEIKDDCAALIIGDRALKQRHHSKYVYDLAGEWKAATGLPFVFAAWVSTKKLSNDFIAAFDAANAYGLQHIEAIAAEHDSGLYDLKKYYSVNLSYELDEEKERV
ncbi:menaquinone biosynthetic enzyme MqnA/MqnD family protein [Niabella ginsengisoli]|uniref:Chorismate dehydratase n=1 Tax=Niabella ginsengisoli TaxID=522298 RepID=A0ABS9SEP4_9BACT|nr:menaquinone biosynthesis protein [Niabella ginsengisoli]MCH5596837.1 menaquinone biosynthesis protein [Niabella ginsengisoli]